MPKKKVGLRVRYHDHVERFGRNGEISEMVAAGWFIEVTTGGRWEALMDLRFAREKDAVRAALSLTMAGLDCLSAMKRAEPMTVLQVACESLQW